MESWLGCQEGDGLTGVDVRCGLDWGCCWVWVGRLGLFVMSMLRSLISINAEGTPG